MSILPTEKRDRQLTEKQQKFLDALVAHNGNPKVAAEVAGYSGNYHQVLKSLKDEVINLAEDVLVQHAPRAAFKLVEVMESDKLIGPYIKAESFEEAEKIAYEYELILVGEIHELLLEEEVQRKVIH